MMSRLRIINFCHVRWVSNSVKYKFDDKINERIDKNEIKARKHPGILHPGTIKMPEKIYSIMNTVLKDENITTLLEESKSLRRHLRAKHPPTDKTVYLNLYKQLQNSYINENEDQNLTQNEIEDICRSNHTRALKHIKSVIYHSNAVNYNKHKSYLYLLGRSMQDYAILTKIFHEIKHRDPTFLPESIFDFGSGIGTVMWAACDMWQNKTNEYFGVDISGDMIDLAEIIIKKLRPEMRKLFFKQYFPVSLQPNYDMTVSAFTLMELPDAKERVNALYKLWKKTKTYMIVVENGNNAGFNLINEARDFILYVSDQKEANNKTHIFSPCPHDLNCPMIEKHKQMPCRFEAIFERLKLYGPQKKKHELYSYIVFKKGTRQDEEWPRIVQPVLYRSKHIWCDICTSSGKLQHTVFTKSKYGKYLYGCIKASDWGDRIPVQEVTEGTKEHIKTSSSLQSEEPTSKSSLD